MIHAFGFGMIEILLMLILSMLPALIALIDILRHDFQKDQKVVWLLVVLLVPALGWILYLVLGRKGKIKN